MAESVDTTTVDGTPEGATSTETTFSDLGLPAAIVAALAKNGITVPSPIQKMAITDALGGRNVLGRAQTGSGKTLAFGLPMLTRLAEAGVKPAAKRPRALVLVPTRELAFQVVDSLQSYATVLGLSVRPAVGGTPFGRQADQLRRGVDVLVATPGRLGDHLRQGTCVLEAVEITALDEADQMADMGFLPEVRDILGQTANGGQRMLFSATLDREVQSLVRQFLADHVQHSTGDSKAAVESMDHYILNVGRGQKDIVLSEIAAREGGRTIMFARTKLGCDGITDRLRAVGIHAESLHGGKAQNQRTRVLDRFKSGRTPVLVATDVAARGIHVDGIDLVVHVDPPADHKDYMHRAGRTARAGAAGTVVAIALPNQRRIISRLTGQAGVKVKSVDVSPGSAELGSITGAKAPSGEPVREAPRRERPSGPSRFGASGSPRTGGYRGGDSGGYRGRDENRTGGYRGGESSGGYKGRDENRTGGYRGGESSGGGYKGRDENRTGGYRGGESSGGYRGRDENRSGATDSRSGGFRSRAAGTARD
ncbi:MULTISPECIES: DEAD/DEAH box helicase [unclassified Rhodococcus (in: high G+C Gram-positive bacteria)]|uniref:DEAD/DEAH box helicase n=1 Tax=unclassified Rhodococcus (in: high G+C Gram-positive bacteria) TaxID=192944 RepID=UPI0009EA9E43|nr:MULTISPECIES: DEAD/DEAH box helicase [unclassified Rhodococcus (in: high G+C Gram-positive bacteria)]